MFGLVFVWKSCSLNKNYICLHQSKKKHAKHQLHQWSSSIFSLKESQRMPMVKPTGDSKRLRTWLKFYHTQLAQWLGRAILELDFGWGLKFLTSLIYDIFIYIVVDSEGWNEWHKSMNSKFWVVLFWRAPCLLRFTKLSNNPFDGPIFLSPSGQGIASMNSSWTLSWQPWTMRVGWPVCML